MTTPSGDADTWFEGSSSSERAPAPAGATWSQAAAEDDFDEVDDDRSCDVCAVCQATPAPWEHPTETPADEALAMSALWRLCHTCHELLAAGDAEGVASRMTGLDFDDAERLQLARRIR